MSDKAKRDAVLVRYKFLRYYFPDHEALADRIVELEAAVERVRAACENELRWVDAQPILRALEETP